jgi:hypothetical protein
MGNEVINVGRPAGGGPDDVAAAELKIANGLVPYQLALSHQPRSAFRCSSLRCAICCGYPAQPRPRQDGQHLRDVRGHGRPHHRSRTGPTSTANASPSCGTVPSPSSALHEPAAPSGPLDLFQLHGCSRVLGTELQARERNLRWRTLLCSLIMLRRGRGVWRIASEPNND